MDPGTLVDLDDQGRVLAIEVIHPSRRWPLQEIVERYGIDDEAAKLLDATWTSQPFTFGTPTVIGARTRVARGRSRAATPSRCE